MDRVGRVIYLSQETYRIFGFNPADGIPVSRDLCNAYTRRPHPGKRRIEEGIRNKVEHSFEYRIMSPDGTSISP